MRLFISGVFVTLFVMVVAGVGGLYTGVYNVAADEDDTAFEKWVLSAAMTNSVKAHTGSITPPSGFGDQHQVGHGFRLYEEMCVQCHGAPGKKPGEVGLGLRPEPSELSKAVRRWNTVELFWILKHGIKATGMPAFGKTHTEEQLWNLVAFVKTIPDLSPEQYKALDESTGPAHGHDHQHDH
jgi:mono/diheme cytochrome c family protein